MIFFLATPGRNFGMNGEIFDNIPWIEQKLNQTDSSYLLKVFWKWVGLSSQQSSFTPLLTCLLLWGFLTTSSGLPDSGPGRPSPQLPFEASQPLCWLFLLEPQVLPNLVTLLHWKPQSEDLVFHSGCESWQPLTGHAWENTSFKCHCVNEKQPPSTWNKFVLLLPKVFKVRAEFTPDTEETSGDTSFSPIFGLMEK